MRGKWVLATAGILALVAVGGLGGLTMRAFAGNARTVVTDTKTVTKLCVYVDRTHGGESYGDVSVVPKYDHKVCITGKPGPSSVVTWNKTVATAFGGGAPHLGGLAPGTVDLAKVGPFTVRGVCSSLQGVRAGTVVISAQNGSSFTWADNNYSGDFDSGNAQQASNAAYGSSESPGFVNENTNGEFSVATADQTTAFTGFANNGVYINGPTGPACSFTGYLVIQK
jgi:hypothetical protein